MKLEPVITEKSTELAKKGKYTFRVGPTATKNEIKDVVSKVFGVKVVGVHTINERGEVKKSFSRRKKRIMPDKKAIVMLGDKDKIDLFETKKSK